MDYIRPTPRKRLPGLLADTLQGINDFASKPFGYDNPPVEMLMGLLGVPAAARTLDRISYGEPLTTGKGMTLKPKEDTVESLLTIAPVSAKVAQVTKDLPVGLSIKPDVLRDALARLEAFQRGENPSGVIKDGLLTTSEQREALNKAYAQLTRGQQPPYERSAMNINLAHIYDSRVSGKIKPSGKQADSFPPAQVVDWMAVAGDDSAKVGANSLGQPYLENLYTDPITGESYMVRLPISARFESGKQWVSGLVPEGKFSQPKKKP